MGVTGCARAAAALLPALIPFVVYQSATVTNDVTALPSGALVLLAVLRYEHGRWRAWVPIVASVVALWLRLTNLFGVGVAVGYLAIRALQQTDRNTRRRLLTVAGMSAAAGLVAAITWTVAIGVFARVPASAIPLYPLSPKHFSIDQIFQSIAPMVPPTTDLPNVTFWTRHSFPDLLAAAAGWPVIAGPLLAIARRHDDGGGGLAIGIPSGLIMLGIGPTLTVINAISADSFLGVPFATRMGVSVVPGCLAAGLGGLRNRRSARLLAIFVSAGLVAMMLIVSGVH